MAELNGRGGWDLTDADIAEIQQASDDRGTEDEMTAWLRAQVEADKAAAGLAARDGGQWKQDDPLRYPGAISSLGGPVVYDEGHPDEYQAAHIAIHDPRDVIADCEAKLAILGRYEKAAADAGENPATGEDAWLLSSVARMLASGYRHRDGWQEGWQEAREP